MITVGNTGYRWNGHNIRTIGNNVVSLPRADSHILISAVLLSDTYYEVKIKAANKGGNGRIQVEFEGETVKCEKQTFYVKSKDFMEYTVKLHVGDLEGKNQAKLRVSRAKAGSGNILIDSVSCTKTNAPITKQQLEAEEAEKAKELRLRRQQELGQAIYAKEKEVRAQELERLLNAEGNVMSTPIKVGGQGYRWRGHSIRTLYKFNATCVSLPRADSSVMIPVNVQPSARYKVTLHAASEKGNSNLLVNFFGGSKADGTHVPVKVIHKNIKSYEIYVNTPKFPANLSMYLRIFKSPNERGNTYIKLVEYAQIVNADAVQHPTRPRLPAASKPKPNTPVKVKKIPTVKEAELMKFKPYKVANVNRKAVNNVLIKEADDVPKVSIITPTRDGLELIQNCYKALNKNTAYPNWEWIVGDSDSSDETVNYLKELKDSRIKIIERRTTEGSFSTINNELVAHASGKYLVFLNNDTRPQPFWLYEMVSKMHGHPEIGVVGAKLLYPNDKIQHVGVMFIPEGPANVGKELLKMMPGGFDKYDRYYQAVTAACLLIRKRDFIEVGKFDPVYHFCYEDIDLCLKVREHLDKKVLYAANSLLYHDESVTQKKHKTSGDLQRAGIEHFKRRWMGKVEVDVPKFAGSITRDMKKVDVTFVTCVNNLQQFNSYVVGSLLKSDTKRNYEIIPVLNFGNPYSAAQALNIGINKARANIVVLCHQDIIFYKEWIDMLFKRIEEIEESDKRWGVLGTAGIDEKDTTVGVVHNKRGKLQWQSTKKKTVHPVQTVDEHCMIIRKNSGLRFDEQRFNGFHFYGPDICLSAISQGMKNYGILCPLVHDSASGSLASGRQEFMRLLNTLADKWRPKFKIIRTPTSLIRKRSLRTFVKFKKK